MSILRPRLDNIRKSLWSREGSALSDRRLERDVQKDIEPVPIWP